MSRCASIPRFVRFALVGAGAVVINMALFLLFVGVLRVPYLAATALIFAVGNAYGFAANRAWTYSQLDRPRGRLAVYYLTMLASLLLNLGLMFGLVDVLHFHYLVASVVTTAILAPLLFLAHDRLAFRRLSEPPASGITLITHYFAEHGGGVEIVARELAERVAGGRSIRWMASGPVSATTGGGLTEVAFPAWNWIERRFGLPIPIPTPRGVAMIATAVRNSELVWIHDVVYIGNIVGAIAALLHGKPLIVTVHVGAIPYRNRITRQLMSWLLRGAGGAIVPRSYAVAFVSERVRAEFATRWSLPRSRLIPNGVDTQLFRPRPEHDRSAIRQAMGLSDRPVAVFVGRFVERKGMGLLHGLARDMPNLTWLFAGSGPVDVGGWSLANVHVVRGWQGVQIAQLYAIADLVVLPSIGEGFPLVVQEALASGARVLVDPSTAAGFPGVGGYVECEPVAGSDALQRWTLRVTQLMRQTDDGNRRDRVAFARRSWSWDRAADEYRQILEDAIGTSVRSS